MYFSRKREYRADAGAAVLMGDRRPMIEALRAGESPSRPIAERNGGQRNCRRRYDGAVQQLPAARIKNCRFDLHAELSVVHPNMEILADCQRWMPVLWCNTTIMSVACWCGYRNHCFSLSISLLCSVGPQVSIAGFMMM